jgi:hypothetical protein
MYQWSVAARIIICQLQARRKKPLKHPDKVYREVIFDLTLTVLEVKAHLEAIRQGYWLP